MKVSRAKFAAHRTALVKAAKRLLQERGIGGAGVADISREAGLTQGALYGQFESKDALVAEAFRKSFGDLAVTWNELRDQVPDALAAYLDTYLSYAHVQSSGSGCPMPAWVSEVGRQNEAICTAFTDGFLMMVETMQRALPAVLPPEAARARTLVLISAMVGSVAVARAVETTNPALAREIILAARTELKGLARR